MRPERAGVEGSLVGLAVAFITLAGCQCDSRPTLVVGFLLAWPLVVLAVLLTKRAGIAAAYLLALGVLHRLGVLLGFLGVDPAGVASDVLTVTGEALSVLLGGGNPYTHAYAHVDPPGTAYVFAYPAGNLLYYLPGFVLGGERMRVTEIVSAGVVLAGLAWSVRFVRSDLPVALMGIYASAPPLMVLSTDNSNDTSAGALIFVAALGLLVARSRVNARLLTLAGLLMGWALSFKIYALVFWPFFVAYLRSQPWEVRLPRRGLGAGRSCRPGGSMLP
jgi:hypothetical protein